MIQNNFINTFGVNTKNITKVDWDVIELTINRLVVENKDTLWMDFFPNHEDHINSFKRNTNSVLDVIKPNLHGVENCDISLEFHVNPKANNNQFSNDSLQLLKDEIHPCFIFSSMVCSLNEEQCVLFDNILYKKQMNPNGLLSIFSIGSVGR